MRNSSLFGLLSVLSCTLAQSTNSSQVVSIPSEYTYLLPAPFTGNVNYTFANGTHTSNDTLNSLLRSATQAPFISYSQEFLNLLGAPHPSPPKLIQQRAPKDAFAYEAGVWVPERNEIWFSSSVSGVADGYPGTVRTYNLATDEIAPLNATPPVRNPNGGYYFEGKVYFASYSGPANSSYRGGIVSVDVKTLQTEMVVNSYFGLPYNGIDDLAWACDQKNCSQKYMFFSDLLQYEGLAFGISNDPQSQLPTAVYRYDPQEDIVLPVISRNELVPNGVRVSPDMKKLYVTDTVGIFGIYDSGPVDDSWLGPYIYSYDLDEDIIPGKRRLFGQVRQGIADGLHVDDQGRVWTGESEGVVVRNKKGRVLGIFNSQYFQQDKSASATPIANFALAGDVLVVLSSNRLWKVKLGEVVVARNSSIVN